MSPPDLPATLPRDDEGAPVFDEPWQAQAFAMTVQLHAGGHFTWPEWAACLAAALDAAGAGTRDPQADYYRCWLAALENLLAAKGLVGEHERLGRRRDWERAARNTPHGRPIELPAP